MAEMDKSASVATRKYRSEGWSAIHVLEAWGLRTTGRSLKDPLKEATGGYSGADDEWEAKRLVEELPGFWTARPALHWVYVEGQPIAEFQPVRYAMCVRYEAQMLALGWGEHLGKRLPVAAKIELEKFENALIAHLREFPFEPVYLPDDHEDA